MVQYKKLKKKLNISWSTTRWVAAGFLLVIAIGTLLLTTPFASASGTWTPLIDALFTATTSVCVTGLVTVTTASHWNLFGQAVILCLIQLGGLGVVTAFTLTLTMLRRKLGIKDSMLIQETYSLGTMSGLSGIIKRIVKGTLIVEGIGAAAAMFVLIPEYGFWSGVWRSVFHAISTFCNAGMDILGDNSLVPYVSSPLMNLVTVWLIIMGGLGFTVWWDIIASVKKTLKGSRGRSFLVFFQNLTLHSKVVLTMTGILFFGGAVMVFLLEYSNPATLGGLSFGDKWMASAFQSATTRTAGMLTIPQEGLRDSTAVLSMILMFIGGSPAGTAGGVKTTTVAMVILTVIATLKGHQDTEVYGRKIGAGALRSALAVITIEMGIVFSAIFLLSAVEGFSIIDIGYEVVSAMGTVGLSRGVTPGLSVFGKLVIIVIMYVGRIGPITMALVFRMKRKEKNIRRQLPESRILIG